MAEVQSTRLLPLLPRQNVSNIQIWVFARVLSIHNLAGPSPCHCVFNSLSVFIHSFLVFPALHSIYRTNMRCDAMFLPVHPILSLDMKGTVTFRMQTTTTHICRILFDSIRCYTKHTHTLIMCTPNLRLQSNIPRWIIANITKKWLGFSPNPMNSCAEFCKCDFEYWSGTVCTTVPANIRSFRMLSHKWIILLSATAARSF